MPFSYKVIPIIEFPTGIPGDDYDQVNGAPSGWSGEPLDFQFVFSFKDDMDTPGPIKKIKLDAKLAPGLVSKIIGTTTIHIFGRPALFEDETWDFLFPNGTIERLPPYNKKPYDTIIKWEPPKESWRLYNYMVTVTAEDPLTFEEVSKSFTLPQYFYWRLQGSWSLFEYLVAKGKNY